MGNSSKRSAHRAWALTLLVASLSVGCASRLERGAEAATKRGDWPLAYATWFQVGVKYVSASDQPDEKREKKYLWAQAKEYEALGHWYDDELPRIQRHYDADRYEEAYGIISTFAHAGKYDKPFAARMIPLYDKIVLAMMNGKIEKVPADQSVAVINQLEALLVDAPEGSVARTKLLALKEREAKVHQAVYEDAKNGAGRRALHGRLAARYGQKLAALPELEARITPRFVVRTSNTCDAVSDAVSKVFPTSGGSGEPIPVLIDVTCQQREAKNVTTEKKEWQETVMDRRTTTQQTCSNKSTYIGTTSSTERHRNGTAVVTSHDVTANTETCKTSSSTSDVGPVGVGREGDVKVNHVKRTLSVNGSVKIADGTAFPISFNDSSDDVSWSPPNGGSGGEHTVGKDLRGNATAALSDKLVAARAAAASRVVKEHSERAEAAERAGNNDVADNEWALVMFASGGVEEGSLRWVGKQYGIDADAARSVFSGASRTDYTPKASPLAYKLKVPPPAAPPEDDDDDD